jgi:ribosomal-protein-alanine N-acetyltransferase
MPIASTLGIDVTPMTLGDIPAVMAIERTSFPRPWPETAYRYELTENPNAVFVVARPSHTTTFHKPLHTVLHKLFGWAHSSAQHATLATSSDPIVGFAGMWMYVDEAHIATIATHPDWRRRGIGERILIHLLREAQKRHAINVTLEVRVGNIVAQNLYRKYGFVEVGQRKAYYQDNREDALIMTIVDFATPKFAKMLGELQHTPGIAG